MELHQPEATSTPTTFPYVKGRKGIRESNSLQSPIEQTGENWAAGHTQSRSVNSSSSRSPSASPSNTRKCSSPKHTKNRTSSDLSESEDELQSDEICEECFKVKESAGFSYNSTNGPQQPKGFGYYSRNRWALLGILVVVLPLAVGYYSYPSQSCTENLAEKFQSIEKRFTNQNEDFWRNIRIGIQEAKEFNGARSIIFLYEGKAELMMNQILGNVSKAAVCNLKQHSDTPDIIQGSDLKTHDYGRIISFCRESLEANGVMIVKNLEKVSGASAQAFHDLCDDYNPVVQHALCLFTIELEQLPEDDPTKFVRNILSNSWNDIGKDDKFDPLLSRISGRILLVTSE